MQDIQDNQGTVFSIVVVPTLAGPAAVVGRGVVFVADTGDHKVNLRIAMAALNE